MDWRRKIVIGMIALGCCSFVAPLGSAQDDQDVFPDSDLPSLLDDDAPAPPDDLPSAAQGELPPAQEGSRPPQIDQEATADEATESLPDDVSPDPAAGRASDTDSTEPIPAGDSPDIDDSDAEILPQETIQERYPNGRVKIERGVSQDETESYVNHGPWRMWDDAGNLIAEGVYRFGKRHGKWSRWYRADEAELFQLPPYNMFSGPFQSQAYFRNDELDGHWIITDSSDTKVSDWTFQAGRRQGESTWFYHTGRPMRVLQYRNGQLHGELLEWDVNNKQVTRVEYQDGRRLERTTEAYTDGQKKVEGMVLQARLVMKQPDDWWAAKLATYARQGKDQKHGEWTAWYANGQMKFSGEYQFDKPHGEFNWWHENGQRSLQATYQNGRKQGAWTWWHPNGQKAIQGAYLADSPNERWVWWHETGKVAQRVDFSAAASGSASEFPSHFGDSIPLRQPQN